VMEFWAYPLRKGETLSSNEWVEWHIHRFLTSRFKAYCLRDGEVGRAVLGTAVLLWTESYRQDPAGTLPDDDVELAQIAGYGADVGAWVAVRDRVLHGWRETLCDDAGAGEVRLGHAVIAEIAQRSFKRKAGKKRAREESNVNLVRFKVREKLKRLGMARLAEAAPVVAEMADWLIEAGLNVTDNNVREAAEVVTGANVVSIGRER
jgi:hypothetical protein